ncbi:hypothetical protein OG948_32835 [Embleya sp. NBC_00888]|uniref:hypothetical protein n=1 Tax=Embleya sp. NBC_00888 TaxID=2975960 RepID=UPI0038706A5B|nr:hypothetical protein OG948_32835 [Embleya sp. NBC_00888]
MTGNAIPAWPVVTIEIAWDDSVRVDGNVIPVELNGDPRAAALAVAAETARLLGRPVRVDAIEPDGTTFPLVVSTDGSATEAGPASSAPQTRRGLFGRRKKAEPSGPPPVSAPDPQVAPSPAPEFRESRDTTPSDPRPAVDATPSTRSPEPARPGSPSAESASAPAVSELGSPTPGFDETPGPSPAWRPPSTAAPAAAPAESRPAEAVSGDAKGPSRVSSTAPGGAAAPVPSREQAHTLGLIRRSIDERDTARALELAAALDATSAATGDPAQTLAGREVHAYVALLSGRVEPAVELYAGAVSIGLRLGADGDWPPRMAENAHYCWLRVKDPKSALALGRLVRDAYTTISAVDSPAAKAVARRMADLERSATA